jgi:protein arginine kinase activator
MLWVGATVGPLPTLKHLEADTMLCQKCNKNEANIHISDAAGGTNATWHLCSSCAAEELAAKASAKQIDLAKLLQILANHAGAAVQTEEQEPTADELTVKKTCPSCGMTDVELTKGRRAGCAQCYETFADMIGPWLCDLHRDSVHRGSRPGACHPKMSDSRAALDVDVLRLELERAVASEAYERAAQLRDAIRKRLQKTEY